MCPSRDQLGASHGVWATPTGLGVELVVGPFVEWGRFRRGHCERVAVGKPEVGTRLDIYMTYDAILTLPHSTLTHHRRIMIS